VVFFTELGLGAAVLVRCEYRKQIKTASLNQLYGILMLMFFVRKFCVVVA